MAKLSSAAWVAHNLGLAVSIGGTIFGREAFHPALRQVDDRQDRDMIADEAWQRFSWVNLAAHGVVAATWFAGRTMLSGREVSSMSRSLTRTKDYLIGAALVTGVASVVVGRILGARTRDRQNALDDKQAKITYGLRRTVGVLGMANLAANVGVGAVTTVLSMEASKSLPFSYISRRRLP